MDAICTKINTEFYAIKSNKMAFLRGQLLFAQHRNDQWINMDAATTYQVPRDSLIINSHLAYMCRHPVDQLHGDETTMGSGIACLSLDLNGVPFIQTALGQHLNFHPFGYFKSFKEQPLTTLAFATSIEGIEGQEMRLILPTANGIQLSVVNALSMCKDGLIAHIMSVMSTRDGKLLEHMVKSAIVYASSKQGFSGQSMASWLGWLMAEFRSLDYGKVNLTFPENNSLLAMFEKIRVPFCGPVSEEWNEDLFRFVISETSDACLGIVENTLDAEQKDTKMRVITGRTTRASQARYLMQVECKNWTKSVTFSDVSVIDNKLSQYSSKIDIILARQFGSDRADLIRKLAAKYARDKSKVVVWMDKVTEADYNVQVLLGRPSISSRYLILIELNDFGTCDNDIQDLVRQEDSRYEQLRLEEQARGPSYRYSLTPYPPRA